MNFKERVHAEIETLNSGKPLEAIDNFFAEDITMYDNDQLFSKGKTNCRTKQEPFINSAKIVTGIITDILLDTPNEVVIFRNKTKFTNSEDKEFQIDGLCWQQWRDGHVIIERYYSGELMNKKLLEFYK